MEKDFHYYAIYRLATLAGFRTSAAETIAYASQYVDDSVESEPIEPFPNQHFDTVRTAHYRLNAFDWNVQKKIYMPFHFLPAGIRWEDPEHFSYVTRPATGAAGELAQKLVDDAAREPNRRFRMIRLGVALHTMADTFSHDDFSGRHDDENNVGRIWYRKPNGGWDMQAVASTVLDIFVPRIGHAEAFKNPDYPFLEWRYENHAGRKITRKNYAVFMKAAETVYQAMAGANPGFKLTGKFATDHPEDHGRFLRLFKKKGDLEKRCGLWSAYTKAPVYDKTTWRKAAVKGDVHWDNISGADMKAHLNTLTGKTGFDHSKWAFFHRAAHKQRSLVLAWLN